MKRQLGSFKRHEREKDVLFCIAGCLWCHFMGKVDGVIVALLLSPSLTRVYTPMLGFLSKGVLVVSLVSAAIDYYPSYLCWLLLKVKCERRQRKETHHVNGGVVVGIMGRGLVCYKCLHSPRRRLPIPPRIHFCLSHFPPKLYLLFLVISCTYCTSYML